MPSGTPRIGSPDVYQSKNPTLSSAAEELLNTPAPKVLGTLDPSALNEAPPPPWEVDPRYAKHDTDARRFVEVPDNWELRWLNPRMVQREGLRDWQAVAGSDPRVNVINKMMIAPDNTIRRGGHEGDFLAWMYRSWVESRNGLKQKEVDKRTGAARDRLESAKEQINRGSYGQYVTVTEAHHPSHTMGEGRSMKD